MLGPQPSRVSGRGLSVGAGLECVGDVNPPGDSMCSVDVGVLRLPRLDPGQQVAALRLVEDQFEHVVDEGREALWRHRVLCHGVSIACARAQQQ